MHEIANLASSRRLKPDPNWSRNYVSGNPPWLENDEPKSLNRGVLWCFMTLCDKQFSGRSGTFRPQALLRVVAGLLVRFWPSLWGWLAHVDPSRCGSRMCRSCRSSICWRMGASQHRTMACGDAGGRSRTAWASLQRPIGRIAMERWLSDPSRTEVLAPTKLGGSGHCEWLSA